MDKQLRRYLNDHLAGAGGAIKVLDRLVQEETSGEDFYRHLKSQVEEDQHKLQHLLTSAGLDRSAPTRLAGAVTAQAGRLKLMWEGFEPGELGLFEALEMLALGIQGKRLLWVILDEIAPAFPEWSGMNFAELELAAIRQRDAVEERRIEAGRAALIDPERRATPREA